jgi:hypothetical protein
MHKKIALLAVMPFALAFLLGSSCKKKEDEAPPPIPSAPAAVTPTPTPTPVPVAIEFDAGAPEDAGADAKKVGGKPADVMGLRACCAALRQNAASMPPPNNAYAASAAVICDSAVSQMASGSSTKAGALGSIGAALKGMGLPPACK